MCGNDNAQTDGGPRQLRRRRFGTSSFRSASHPLGVNTGPLNARSKTLPFHQRSRAADSGRLHERGTRHRRVAREIICTKSTICGLVLPPTVGHGAPSAPRSARLKTEAYWQPDPSREACSTFLCSSATAPRLQLALHSSRPASSPTSTDLRRGQRTHWTVTMRISSEHRLA